VASSEMLKLRTFAPLIVIGVSGLVVGTSLALMRSLGPPLYINETPSEPRGIYRLIRHPGPGYRRGMYVIFPVPEEWRTLVYGRGWMRNGIPFLKELAGVPGDTVCVSRDALRINDRYIGPVFERDSRGLSLPQHVGCFVVPAGYFFAASRYLKNSFDGRYFGALPMSLLIGEARPVWTF
jgi:conjugative transfer signal peptidase TraF